MGRPTIYSPELIAEICSRISEGQSLRTICRSDDMPSLNTIFVWLSKYPEFNDRYAIAKLEQSEALVEDLLEISDDRSEDPASRRVRIDTRKWIAAKLKPKKYGDRQEIEHSGAIGIKEIMEELDGTSTGLPE